VNVVVLELELITVVININIDIFSKLLKTRIVVNKIINIRPANSPVGVIVRLAIARAIVVVVSGDRPELEVRAPDTTIPVTVRPVVPDLTSHNSSSSLVLKDGRRTERSVLSSITGLTNLPDESTVGVDIKIEPIPVRSREMVVEVTRVFLIANRSFTSVSPETVLINTLGVITLTISSAVVITSEAAEIVTVSVSSDRHGHNESSIEVDGEMPRLVVVNIGNIVKEGLLEVTSNARIILTDSLRLVAVKVGTTSTLVGGRGVRVVREDTRELVEGIE